MISQELEVSLHMAFVEARSARHEFITVEHLLLALLDNASAVEVLRACAANLDDLRRNLRQFVSENTPVIPSGAEVDTQPTLGFQRVIQRASCMYPREAPARSRLPAPMCSWPFSAKRIRTPCITCSSRA